VARALQSNPDALEGTTYAKVFRESSPEDPEVFFGLPMNAETLSSWVTDKDLTLVTVPGAGHFVQQDSAELVTSTMRSWLDARPE